MGDILAVRNEYRQIQWAMVIQKCKARELTNKKYGIPARTSQKELLLPAEETLYENSGLCPDAVPLELATAVV